MPVTVRPIGMLKTYIGNQSEAMVEAGHTIRQTLADLGIPPELVALVMVNQVQQDKDFVLADGDLVQVIAVIGGGS
jgi:sulfur carrier protein ThiS